MGEPREKTIDEVRQMFLEQCRVTVEYWARLPGKTDLEKCDGVAFSILGILDGVSGGCVGFAVTPNPHPDDKAFHQAEEEDWLPSEGDIAGGLHELYVKR